MIVDAVICTYNSGKTLEKCLESIVRAVPVGNIWIVDNFSTDNTVEVAEKFGANIVKTRLSLAESRKLSFGLAETELFCSFDSDIVLPQDWFKQVYEVYLKASGKVGVVWGLTIDQNCLYGEYEKTFYRLKNPCKMSITHMPNMLVNKKAVEGLYFPECLLSGSIAHEDYWFKKYVRSRGFQVLTAPVVVDHYHTINRLEKAFWYGAGERVIGRTNFTRLIRSQLLSFIKALLCGVVSRKIMVFPYMVHYNFNLMRGWLGWTKFLVLRREK